MKTNKQIAYEMADQQLESPFSLQEYRERLDRIRAAMAGARIDVLVLSSPEAMHYVSGYAAEWYQGHSPIEWVPGSCIAIHVDHDRLIHFDEEDEAVLIKLTSIASDVRIREHYEGPAMQDFVVEALVAEGWLPGVVGLELWSYRPNRGYSEIFQTALEGAGCSVVDGTSIVRRLKKVKSPQELAYIRTAQAIADVGMTAAREAMRPGVTELDVWAELTYAMAKAGGEPPAIMLPVASGRRSHCVHALSSRREIVPGDIVNVDICGVYNRYHANMARCFSIGEPHPEVRDYVKRVTDAVGLVAETIRPNLPVRDLLDTVEHYYRVAGIFDDHWWIGGYELGASFPPDWVGEFHYEIGVDPGDALFEPGTVVNYEANFYLPRAAGLAMCINTLAFTEGSAEFLQQTPPELIVIE